MNSDSKGPGPNGGDNRIIIPVSTNEYYTRQFSSENLFCKI